MKRKMRGISIGVKIILPVILIIAALCLTVPPPAAGSPDDEMI